MTYAAYLRIYEPVSACHEPDRSRRAAHAASSARPRRSGSLLVEHSEGAAPDARRAIDGAVRGECELAVAMYTRALSRWRAFAEFELAN